MATEDCPISFRQVLTKRVPSTKTNQARVAQQPEWTASCAVNSPIYGTRRWGRNATRLHKGTCHVIPLLLPIELGSFASAAAARWFHNLSYISRIAILKCNNLINKVRPPCATSAPQNGLTFWTFIGCLLNKLRASRLLGTLTHLVQII